MHPLEADPLLFGMLHSLRRSLGCCPEPSGGERATAETIRNFLTGYHPDRLITNVGGHGVLASYDGSEPGPTVLVRAELDALLTDDKAKSKAGATAAHRCGHDGHMTIVAGLAPLLHQRRPRRGRVVLLFQPAEETGEGAQRVIADPQFADFRPNYALALHNIPGYPTGAIVTRPGTFASASVGMRVRLHGVAAHAAEPESARSPSACLSRLLVDLPELTQLDSDPYRLLTITYARLGRASFGVTPGYATLCATLRSASSDALGALRDEAEARVRSHATRDALGVEVAWVEAFPATVNDPHLAEVLSQHCRATDTPMSHAAAPFRWSEDFGHFTTLCPSLYFGLGIGEDAPRLHQPDYAFPDEVVGVGIQTFVGIIEDLTERRPP